MARYKNKKEEVVDETETQVYEPDNTISSTLLKASDEKPRVKGNWIDMNDAELQQYQKDGKLLGYDPKTGQGLLKEDS